MPTFEMPADGEITIKRKVALSTDKGRLIISILNNFGYSQCRDT